MFDTELDRYAKILGSDRADIRKLLSAAARSQDSARIAKSVLRARLRRAGVDPDDPDAFRVAPDAYDLGGDGVLLGSVAGGDTLTWRHDEIAYSALIGGAPGFGKTSTAIRLLLQLVLYYTIVVIDLRGDYECLCRTVPNARFFVIGEFPLNLLRGPSRVPPAVFNQRFAEIFTDRFDQRQSSRRYLNMMLDLLDARRAQTGHWPCLLDLLDILRDRKEPRGSDALRFRDRCLARVEAICRALGERALGVEQGIDLERLLESGSLLIFRMEIGRAVQDFVTNWILMYAFEHRTYAQSKFTQKPIIFFLDEQRGILAAGR